MAEYNIGVGLELEKSSIGNLKEQINNVVRQVGQNITVKVNVEANNVIKQTSAINDSIQSKIKPVQINVDTNNFQNKINQINNQIKGLVSRTDSGNIFKFFDTDIIISDVNEAVSYLSRLQSKINETFKSVNQLMINPRVNINALQQGTSQLTQMIDLYREIEAQFNKISIETSGAPLDTSGLNFNFGDIQRQVEMIKAKIADTTSEKAMKSEAEQINNAYREALNLRKQITALSAQQQKATDNNNTSLANTLQKQIDALSSQYSEIMQNFGAKFNPSQIKEINAEITNLSEKLNIVAAQYKDTQRKIADTTAEKKAIAEINNAYKDMLNIRKQITSLSVQRDTASNKGNTTLVAELQQQIDLATKQANELFSKFGSSFSTAQLESINNEFTNLENKTKAISAAYEDFQRKVADTTAEKKAVAEINEAYKETLSIRKQITSLSVQKEKAIGNGDTSLVNTLQKQIDTLSSQYQGIMNKFGAKFNPSQLHEINTEIANLGNKIKIVDAQYEDTQRKIADTTAEKKAIADFKELLTVRKEIANTNIEVTKRTQSGKDVADLTAKLGTLKTRYEELYAVQKGNLNDSQITRLNAVIDEESLKIKQLKTDYEQMRNALAAKYSENNFAQLDSDIQKVENDMRRLSEVPPDVANKIKNLKTSFETLKSTTGTKNIIAGYEGVKSKINEVTLAIKNQQNAEKTALEQSKLEAARSSLYTKMSNWLNTNTAAAKQFGTRIKSLQAQISTADKSQLTHLKSEFDKVDAAAASAGTKTKTFFTVLGQKFKQLSTYYSSAMLISKVIQGIRSIYKNIVEIDKAMTGLYRVTDLTASGYEKLYDTMIKSAQRYGATLTSIINATTEWVKLGFNPTEASGLSEITAMYQHVTDLDAKEATKNLVTAYKGFEQELLATNDNSSVKSMEMITDVYDLLGNRFAESAADVGNGLAKAAAVLAEGGNSFQESAALFTGIQEVLQDSGTAGNTLKILSLRIRGMKGQLQELGEEVDENIVSVSKMQTQILNLTNGKVNIFNSDKTFKSTYQIMKEIAAVYNDLSETKQAELLELISGKQRASGVASLVRNWSQVEKALEQATNAQGTAAAENEKYLNSLEGHVNTLKATWQSFSTDVLNSDFVKFFVDTGTNIINIFDDLTKKLGALPTIISTIYTVMSLRGVGELINQFHLLITLRNEYAHEVLN